MIMSGITLHRSVCTSQRRGVSAFQSWQQWRRASVRGALEFKEEIHGLASLQAAITLNALGEAQSRLTKFDEAEVNLRRAVAICNSSGTTCLQCSCVSRNLEQVFVAWSWGPDQTSCGNYNLSCVGYDTGLLPTPWCIDLFFGSQMMHAMFLLPDMSCFTICI
jgi:hypothetical protein